ncbi:MAG: DNA repair protein RecN [Flavobacteriaceae bacterium]|nr:DNA repair protein RecN [Flavobacteriaceae bacterium]
MLISLSIKNYALIENLKVDFQDKFSIITGETGAGKSIILGGLSLVLGKRADASLVKNKDKKCIIEVEFAIEKYNLESFFEEENLDYDPIATIRREILPNGKSRAFINDTPTTLTALNTLSKQLIDVHSQHETLQLADSNFQFQIIDALANNAEYLTSYAKGLSLYKKISKELEEILSNQQKEQNELDYNTFLFNELREVGLKENEQEELEEMQEKLSHVEDIKLNLSESIHIIEGDQIGLRNLLNQIKNNLENIATYSSSYQQLSNRVNSLFIELVDLVETFESENENIVYNPDELEKLNDRLQIIYSLQKKHTVDSIKGLLEIQSSLELKLNAVANASKIIEDKKLEIKEVKEKLENLALKIHENRSKAIPVFTKQLEKMLTNLEMKNTRLSINLNLNEQFLSNGKDKLEFLISANKGLSFENLKKSASGGEISRIMLAIKTIMSRYTKLPAIIFDEIDTGVSGEVSNKIAEVMQHMSENMQVITITHLPQIAAKGNYHYKVFKEESKDGINSNIKLLDENERIVELAEMLGGKDLSDSAIAHAKQLLN